jgi:hypothetical protein
VREKVPHLDEERHHLTVEDEADAERQPREQAEAAMYPFDGPRR